MRDRANQFTCRVLGARVLAGLFAVALGAAGTVVSARPAGAATTFEGRMLELVNQSRAAAGVAPLASSPALAGIAQDAPYQGCGYTVAGRSTDMGTRNYFSHTILNCGGRGVTDMLKASGVAYTAASENIAWVSGMTDPLIAAERLHNDLMADAGHRANVLNPTFTTVGIGSWHTASGQTWTGGGSALANVWITAQVFAQMPLTTAPAMSLSATSVDFGDRPVGAAGPSQAVTVTNGGSASMTITGVSLGGANPGDFTIPANGCGSSLAAGASCSVSVGFVPTAAGSRSAGLTISDNAPGSPHAVALTGTGASAAPGVVQNLVATGADGSLTATWKPAASGAPAESYYVYAYDANGYAGSFTSVCGTCTTATVTGLANGKQYDAVVYAKTATAWGSPATSGWVWVLAVPAAPGNTLAVPGDGQLTMSWVAPTTANAGIDGYGVVIFDGNGFTGKYVWVCATCTSATVTGLTNGTSYYPAVYAHNANGWGAGGVWNWLVAGTPLAPRNVVATKGTGSLTATWAAAPGGVAPTGYGALVYDANGYTGQYVGVCATCTSATIAGLAPGKQYTVVVYAYDAFGWGAPASSLPVAL